MNENYEVRHWSQKFGVTMYTLKQAVQKVGPLAKDVENKLAGRRAGK